MIVNRIIARFGCALQFHDWERVAIRHPNGVTTLARRCPHCRKVKLK